MKPIKPTALLLALGITLASLGCGSTPPADTPDESSDSFSDEVKKEDPGEIGELKLRDNPLLYENHNPEEVVTMYLTVSRGNSAENTDHTWAEINTYSTYDYDRMGVERYKVAGLIQVGDENGPLAGELGYGQRAPNCTVQIRGQTSSRNAQKNYKISVKDNKGEWNGQTTIALNKHQSDGLRFRNKMAYDLMAGIDEMMGLRTTFVHLYVKDTTEGANGDFVDYGLYTQVEQLNKTALRAHGLDRKGHLYKINFFEFHRYEDVIMLKDDPNYDQKAFEERIEIKGDDDHTKLIEMLDAVNDYSVSPDELLEKYFDAENLAYWMAFHILVGNRDTQSRNVYIYSPLNSDKWYFYSWDNDAMLKANEYALQDRIDGSEWELGVSNYWGNVLFRRVLKSESFRKTLDAAIEDLYEYLSLERLSSMANRYKEIVKPYVYSNPDAVYAPLTEEEYDYIASSLYDNIESNYKYYWESFKKPMPFFVSPPQIIDGEWVYVWDNAYDFNAETITYSIMVATEYTFQNILLEEHDLLIPEVKGDVLPPGQYFIRVEATNKSGNSQYCFDYYVNDNGKIYGAKCFYVMDDGSIVEDVYVEG